MTRLELAQLQKTKCMIRYVLGLWLRVENNGTCRGDKAIVIGGQYGAATYRGVVVDAGEWEP